jgi:hypothetical protein
LIIAALVGVVTGHRAARADNPIHRGDVDDAGRRGGAKQIRGQSAQVHHADQTDLDHPSQVIQGLVCQRSAIADAGIVDQHIEPAMPAGKFGEVLAVQRVGDVAGQCLDPAPAFPCQLVQAVGAAGGNDDVRPGPMQHPGEACPQPSRGACHQGDTAV